MAKPKKKVSPHVTCPASPQTLSMGRNFLFCLFFVFSKFLPPWPKNAPKPMEKPKKKSFTPCHLSSFSSDPPMGRFFFGFLEVFATLSVQQCQSLIFLCVFCFPVSWVPGRNFHPDKHPLAQLSLLHILYWCLHWVNYWFGYWAIREKLQ